MKSKDLNDTKIIINVKQPEASLLQSLVSGLAGSFTLTNMDTQLPIPPKQSITPVYITDETESSEDEIQQLEFSKFTNNNIEYLSC